MNPRSVRLRLWSIAGFLCAAAGADAAPANSTPPVPPLRVVYFVTRDRQPCQDFELRLDRVMREVQRFYREGMKAAGFGERSFCLETNAQGRLRLHRVQARQNSAAYGRNASDPVRREVGESLKRDGIDIDRETIVIFQTLLKWEGAQAIEVGPYVGGGNHLSGTAWVYDDDRLDPELLASKAPGGYYGRPCSVGEFNSHYVGGVAHELGHALGLPHLSETQAQRRTRGHALMGGGNHTYGDNLRGEGTGTFLHPVSALRLLNTRPFAGPRPNAAVEPACRLQELTARFDAGKLILTGRLQTDIPATGLGAYDDWTQVPADYDAIGWLGELQPDGRFRVAVEELRRGPSQLRLTVAHANGATTTFPFDYTVDNTGRPDIDAFQTQLVLAELGDLFRQGNRDPLAARVKELALARPTATNLHRLAEHLLTLLNPPVPQPLADIPATRQQVPLSQLRLDREEVGWGRPCRDQVLAEGERPVWLQVHGQFFARGFYAHAPAHHALQLTPGWKWLHTGYGLQDGADGSVVFVIRGDGRELFRSATVRDHTVREVDVDLTGVQQLALEVQDAGDGPASDWGVWLSPELRRAN